MKVKNLWIAMAALAVTGCSQNEITEMSPDVNPAVGFSVYTGTQTRGAVIDLPALKKAPATTTGSTKGGGFGILAYYTGTTAWTSAAASTAPNFMYNQKVTWSGSAWAYSPLKYWPNTADEKISFFAYGPYDAAANFPSGTVAAIDNGIELSAVGATGAPTLTFTIKAAEDMVDLVAANAKDKAKSSTAVEFSFKHLLSRANFQAKLDKDISGGDGKTYVCVTGAQILGTTPAGGASSSGFYSKATYKWANDTWDYGSGAKQSAAYSLENILSLKNRSSESGDLNGKGYTTPSVVLTQDGTAKNLFKHNGEDSHTGVSEYLFLIPPTDATDLTSAGGVTSSADVKVQVSYDIITFDDALNNGTGEKFSKTSTTAVVSLPEGSLKRGKAYNFIFTIGLNAITVTAKEVADWAEEDVYVSAACNETAIKAAIKTMSEAKAANSGSTHFTINVEAASVSTATFDLSGATYTNFAAGDKIVLDFSKVSFSSATITITPASGWTADPTSLSAAGTITLTKNPS